MVLLRGDLNIDTLINVQDVQFMINHILNKPGGPWILSDYDLYSADINNDGLINVQDVQFLINHILNKPGGPWILAAQDPTESEPLRVILNPGVINKDQYVNGIFFLRFANDNSFNNLPVDKLFNNIDTTTWIDTSGSRYIFQPSCLEDASYQGIQLSGKTIKTMIFNIFDNSGYYVNASQYRFDFTKQISNTEIKSSNINNSNIDITDISLILLDGQQELIVSDSSYSLHIITDSSGLYYKNTLNLDISNSITSESQNYLIKELRFKMSYDSNNDSNGDNIDLDVSNLLIDFIKPYMYSDISYETIYDVSSAYRLRKDENSGFILDLHDDFNFQDNSDNLFSLDGFNTSNGSNILGEIALYNYKLLDVSGLSEKYFLINQLNQDLTTINDFSIDLSTNRTIIAYIEYSGSGDPPYSTTSDDIYIDSSSNYLIQPNIITINQLEYFDNDIFFLTFINDNSSINLPVYKLKNNINVRSWIEPEDDSDISFIFKPSCLPDASYDGIQLSGKTIKTMIFNIFDNSGYHVDASKFKFDFTKQISDTEIKSSNINDSNIHITDISLILWDGSDNLLVSDSSYHLHITPDITGLYYKNTLNLDISDTIINENPNSLIKIKELRFKMSYNSNGDNIDLDVSNLVIDFIKPYFYSDISYDSSNSETYAYRLRKNENSGFILDLHDDFNPQDNLDNLFTLNSSNIILGEIALYNYDISGKDLDFFIINELNSEPRNAGINNNLINLSTDGNHIAHLYYME